MSEEAAFLEEVAENPDELGPRLRYADYLDESLDQASAARAEFIRVQCALDYLPESDPAFADVAQRERELLDANWRIWMWPICQEVGEPLPVPQSQRSWVEWMRRRFQNGNQSLSSRWEIIWGSGSRPKHFISWSRPPRQNGRLTGAVFVRGFVAYAFVNARPANNSTFLERLFERTPISQLGLSGFDRSAMQHLAQKRLLRRLRKLDLVVSTPDFLVGLIDEPDACLIRSFNIYPVGDEANSSVLLLSEAKTLQPEEIEFYGFAMNGNDMRALADSPFMARTKHLVLNGVSFDEPALIHLLERTSIEHLDFGEEGDQSRQRARGVKNMDLNLNRIRDNARKASTESLLDRVTVCRDQMESASIEIFEAELIARGITRMQVVAHMAMRERDGLLRRDDGTVITCSHCSRPAIESRRKWHRLWGWFVPLFPRTFHFCKEHLDRPPTDAHGRPLHHIGEQEDPGDGA